MNFPLRRKPSGSHSALATAAVCFQVFGPPVVGLSNNGDFGKIAAVFRLGALLDDINVTSHDGSIPIQLIRKHRSNSVLVSLKRLGPFRQEPNEVCNKNFPGRIGISNSLVAEGSIPSQDARYRMIFSKVCPGSLARFLLQIESFCLLTKFEQHDGQVSLGCKRTGMVCPFSSNTTLYGLAEDNARLFDVLLF